MSTRNRLQETAFKAGWVAVASQPGTDTWEKMGETGPTSARRVTVGFSEKGRFACGMVLAWSPFGGWDGTNITWGWEVVDDTTLNLADTLKFLKEN